MHIEMVNALLDQGNDALEDTNLPDALSMHRGQTGLRGQINLDRCVRYVSGLTISD